MNVQEQALRLPKQEKFQLMEALWDDLSDDPDNLPSPSWHRTALLETERRVAASQEVAIDWEDAKRLLQGRQ